MEVKPRVPSSQSLSTTMNKFVHAVEEMDRTIMIPSKLQDIDFPGVQLPSQNGQAGNDNNNTVSSDGIVTLNSGMVQGKCDLFTCYKMLNAVRSELGGSQCCHPTTGGASFLSTPDEEEDTVQEKDEQCEQVAAAFRHHLQGLFSVLHQLTMAADTVKGKYQEELGEIPSSLSSLQLHS